MKITYEKYNETREALYLLFGSFGTFEFLLKHPKTSNRDWAELLERQEEIADLISKALSQMETIVLTSSDVEIDFHANEEVA